MKKHNSIVYKYEERLFTNYKKGYTLSHLRISSLALGIATCWYRNFFSLEKVNSSLKLLLTLLEIKEETREAWMSSNAIDWKIRPSSAEFGSRPRPSFPFIQSAMYFKPTKAFSRRKSSSKINLQTLVWQRMLHMHHLRIVLHQSSLINPLFWELKFVVSMHLTSIIDVTAIMIDTGSPYSFLAPTLTFVRKGKKRFMSVQVNLDPPVSPLNTVQCK